MSAIVLAQSVAQPGSLSYRSLFVSLSRARVSAYSLDSDRDSADAVARYLWNMALASAFLPVLQLAEVAFRNALYDIGVEATSRRTFKTGAVPCWLNAVPSLLERREEADVLEAIRRLGHNRRRLTPGHLVGQLGFGFWTRLCNRPYEHGRKSGPQLWPEATRRFPDCPRSKRNRIDIGQAFGELREFRNQLAHHQPIWDRKPLEWHARAIELIGWMNPSLATATKAGSRFAIVYDAGPERFRSFAEDTLIV